MTNLRLNNDFELVSRLKTGDVKAFETLFKKYSQKVYHFSFKYLRSESDAEDVVQDVFLKIWKKRKKLKPKLSFSAYLFTITFNSIKRIFSKKAKYNSVKNRIETDKISRSNYIELATDYHIINTKLEQIIKKMPVRRKLIYLKKFEEGKSVKEIASELNISPKTVENQITEANKLIHKELHREETELQTFFKNIQN